MRALRKSHREVFGRKGVLKIFTKFTGKYLRWGLFFNGVAGRLAASLKKRLQRSSFPGNFVKFLRTPFYKIPPVALALTEL